VSQTNEILIDAFERIKQVVHETVEGLSIPDLTYQPAEAANTIAWLMWHLTRIQDDHIAELRKKEQVWIQNGWADKFKLPFNKGDTGYGHDSRDVIKVNVDDKLILGYYDDVHSATKEFLLDLKNEDYTKVIDNRWEPPVTFAVRVVSVISDDLQHAGQAAYVRGLIRGEPYLGLSV
jgi:hypothetical protein